MVRGAQERLARDSSAAMLKVDGSAEDVRARHR